MADTKSHPKPQANINKTAPRKTNPTGTYSRCSSSNQKVKKNNK